MESQGKTTSRLAQMQMRYQQKQKVELEQKRSEIIGGGRGLAAIDANENGKMLPALIGNGKVRQMFVERRQRVTGIDKSYPLQPISKSSPVNSTRQKVTAVSTTRATNGESRYTNVNQFARTAKSFSPNVGLFNDTDAITNRINRNIISSKLTDDSIDNEPFPDIFNHLDETDSFDSDRKMLNVNKQMASLQLNNNNNNVKLKPVVTKKTVADVPALNGHKKLPPATKARATPFGVERAATPMSPVKKVSVTKGAGFTPKTSTIVDSPVGSAKRLPSGQAPPNSKTCHICGRHFNEERIDKHITICQKTSTKKRKIFDATKHRVKGTEAEQYVKKMAKPTAATQKRTVDSAGKKSDWRRKHEEFIQAIRSAKQVQQHLAKGGKLSDLPPPPPSENPDYVQCPNCKRRFNESAAQRHIPKCASFQHNKPKPTAARTMLAKKRF